MYYLSNYTILSLPSSIHRTHIHTHLKGGIPLQVFPATCRKYFNFKTIFYQLNYNFSGDNPTVQQLA